MKPVYAWKTAEHDEDVPCALKSCEIIVVRRQPEYVPNFKKEDEQVQEGKDSNSADFIEFAGAEKMFL